MSSNGKPRPDKDAVGALLRAAAQNRALPFCHKLNNGSE